MMKLMRAVVSVTALLSAFVAVPAVAGAVTWENSGDTAFTATGGAIAASGTTGFTLTCTSSDLTGVAGTSPFVGLVWKATHDNVTYTGCTSGGAAAVMSCTDTFTAVALSGGVVTGTLDSSCTFGTSVTLKCVFHGGRPASFTDPTPQDPAAYDLAHATLTATDLGNDTCPAGNNKAVTFAAEKRPVTMATGGPSPHLGPFLNRTP
jgi:hypothetical protein